MGVQEGARVRVDRFPDPLAVRQRRGPVPDSLVRLADGLADQACRQRLARLTMGPPGHPGLDGAQVVTATDYRPYESPGIPNSPDGDRLRAEFMDALFSDEVTKSVQESGPLAILAATDAARRILAGPGTPWGTDWPRSPLPFPPKAVRPGRSSTRTSRGTPWTLQETALTCGVMLAKDALRGDSDSRRRGRRALRHLVHRGVRPVRRHGRPCRDGVL